MAIRALFKSEQPALKRRTEPAFTEARAWAPFGDGWRQLHGSFRDLGYSIEWHDFTAESDLDWAQSFHPGGVEICLNLAGRGAVQMGNRTLEFGPSTAGYYAQSRSLLEGMRRGGERHHFVTIEFSLPFLERHVSPSESGLTSGLRSVFASHPRGTAVVSEPVRLTSEHQQMVMSLRRPPVCASAQRMWYQAKALEVASALFFQPRQDEELFCKRQHRLNRERVQKVVSILKHNLAEPMSLEEIGRRAGCSHFYLSRIFTQEMGQPIFQCLRQLRLERAAELLREGKLNVTQVALEVGYSSPSHFSMAFHETFGCCPGLYPLTTTSQRPAERQGVS